MLPALTMVGHRPRFLISYTILSWNHDSMPSPHSILNKAPCPGSLKQVYANPLEHAAGTAGHGFLFESFRRPSVGFRGEHVTLQRIVGGHEGWAQDF